MNKVLTITYPTRHTIGIIIILTMSFQDRHINEVIQTRPYRAPEVIIGAVSYISHYDFVCVHTMQLIRPSLNTRFFGF